MYLICITNSTINIIINLKRTYKKYYCAILKNTILNSVLFYFNMCIVYLFGHHFKTYYL